MPSGTLDNQTALTTPTATMILYTVISPFDTASDRKITSNDLLATITKNIADISLQFDDGLGTATVSAAGKAKLRYNDTSKTFQASYDGAAYVDLASGGGGGTPGAPGNSVQYNNAGNFGGDAGFIYDPTATRNALITSKSTNMDALVVKGAVASPNNRIFSTYNSTETFGLEFSPSGNTQSGDTLCLFQATGSPFFGIQAQQAVSAVSAGVVVYTDTSSVGFFANNSQAANANLAEIPASSGIRTSTSGATGGIVLVTRTANAPIIFGTSTDAFSSERGRFDANGLTLGKASISNGKLTLAVSGSANTQSHTAPAAPASSLTFVWPSADPTAGQKLTASAPSAGVVTLSWT